MRTALLAGMIGCIAGCVASSLAGVPLLALGWSFGGMALFAVAAERARPTHWTPAEHEHRADNE